MQRLSKNKLNVLKYFALSLIASLPFYSCEPASGNVNGAPPPQYLPVIAVDQAPATVHQEFNTYLEGTKEIEIRPQVDGILEKIYVDEGDYIKKGQLLFQIDDRPFTEQLVNAKAELTAAKANLANAEINVSKLVPLVENKVISDVQLKTAQAAYDAAAANVAKAL